MNVTLLSGACIPIVIDHSSLSAVHILCLLVYMSALYAIIVSERPNWPTHTIYSYIIVMLTV